MKKIISLLLVLALLLGTLPATVFAASREKPTAVPNPGLLGLHGPEAQVLDTGMIPDASTPMNILVVLDESHLPQFGVPASAAAEQMRLEQAAVQNVISRQVLDGAAVPVRSTHHILTNAFSMKATYGQLQQIRELDCVASAYEIPSFRLEPNMKTSSQMVGGGSFNRTGFSGEGTVVAILDTGVDLNHEAFQAAPKNPRLTPDTIRTLLEEQALQCESIVPGVGADTLYFSEKIPFQFDYGEQDADGNPPESGGEHGTHVASTAAANRNEASGFSGVAPDAQIVNMKVFQKGGGASFDDIISALEDCILLGVDAANLSLGSDCGFIDFESPDPFTQNLLDVFDRVGNSGVCLSVAVGNAYSAAYKNNYGGKALASNPDYGNASMPASFHESLAVAAVENAGLMAPYIQVGDQKIAYYDGYDFASSQVTTEYALRTLANHGSLTYVPVPGMGRAEDYQGLDLTGKIALVSRGEITYEEKANAAADAGALGMIVYNNVSGMVLMSISQWRIPIGFVSQTDGRFLLAQADRQLTIGTADALVPSPVAGMCDFSSWGATSELTLKPEITAPGGNIYAAIPGNRYELMSGTSMAAPHVAGGMAIVRQALAQRYPELTPDRLKDLVDTALMSNAQILADGETPVSPRKQGAGLMDINRAVNSRSYLTVSGMERPKLELGDDEACTGVYDLTVTVHNDSAGERTYRAFPLVLTDQTQEVNGRVLMTETDTALAHTFTTDWPENLVTVPAGSTAEVTVTVRLTDPEASLAQFPNGAFVEGWVCLEQISEDGTESYDLNAPFLTFYGDWTQAPMIDSAYWWDELAHETTDAQVWPNEALLASMENTYHTFLGANNYDVSIPYLADRNAISPDENDFMDCLGYVHTGLLRSARHFVYRITGEDGTVYYEKDAEYNSKSVYNNNLYSIVPAGAVRDFGDTIDPWYGTDQLGMALPNNTKAVVSVTASPVYGEHESHNLRDSWSFPITVDTEKPEASDIQVRESEGRYYAAVTVSDNQYVAAAVLTDARFSKEFSVYGVGETAPGKATVLKDLDITGLGETVGLVVHDYAGNSKTFYIHAHGNTDDYADVEVTEDMILFRENFDGSWLPENWSQSPKASAKTWYRDDDRWAAIDYDSDFPQNEWLYTPEYDLSGQNTQIHAIFTFSTSYTYSVQYPHFNVQVMASDDGGSSWEPIWSLKDSGLFTDWTATQARVTIPDRFQGLDHVRFAFVYTGDTNGASFAFDDFILYKDRAELYAAVQAQAGEHGSIRPAGRTLIRKGNSRTFTALPDAGYQVESMTVDGRELGPISSYVLEKVGTDHTVSASFCPDSGELRRSVRAEAVSGGTIAPSGNLLLEPGTSQTFRMTADPGFRLAALKINGRSVGSEPEFTLENIRENCFVEAVFEKIPDAPEVIFRQDFEEEAFAPEGWTVRGSDHTWIRKSYYYMNKTQSAYVSYEPGQAQDEWLISPTVNLLNASSTLLEFDYAFPYYPMRNGEMEFRLVGSADGGNTWTELWNAENAMPDTLSGNVVRSRAFVELPQALCSQGVSFAWQFSRPAQSDSGIACVDNIQLQAAGVNTDPQGFARITASAGTGGRISPDGRVQVREHADQTFAITPDTGFVIKDITVDGVSQGAAEAYTFRDVTGTHTIHAEFMPEPLPDGILFRNDFEDPDFPARGWSVRSQSSSRNHWEQGALKALNDTHVARVVNDYVDWSDAPAQDEWLISPAVDLTETQAVLHFDTRIGRYELLQGYIHLEVQISRDGGSTWEPIWDAQNAFENEGGMYIGGSVSLNLPEAYRTDSVMLAFRYTKPAGTEGAMAAVDNVVLQAACSHGSTRLENAAEPTCTQDGYTGDLVCADCGQVLEPGTVIPALGHDWGDWEVTRKPTETVPGQEVRTCRRCGETESREIPVLEKLPFTDVREGDWFYPYVRYVYENHLMVGLPDHLFGPENSCTRAQIVTVLYRMAGEPSVEGLSNPFRDVPEKEWYAAPVIWAANHGIAFGTEDTAFSPDDLVTRQQMVAFLYRYAGFQGMDLSYSQVPDRFPDWEDVEPYARPCFAWAVENQIIRGKNGRLEPEGSATRAQIATVLTQLDQMPAR